MSHALSCTKLLGPFDIPQSIFFIDIRFHCDNTTQEKKSHEMDSQGSSRRSSACSVPDVDTCGLEDEQVSDFKHLNVYKIS